MKEMRSGAKADDAAFVPPRSFAARLTLMACAAFFFAIFIALGTWQVQRLQWKRDLIEHVQQRVHAAPMPAPPPARWSRLSAQADEYRHVQIAGRYLGGQDTLVIASTERGLGYWLMAPLRADDGGIVLINRGFVSEEEGRRLRQTGANLGTENPHEHIVVTGLLRMAEPHGFWPRRNEPSTDRWYSRELGAIAARRGLPEVAPYFIDADAQSAQFGGAGDARPVGGLTVIDFPNNHLVYLLTWYALALMTAVALWWLLRDEIRLRRAMRQ
ncbi:SURF1 family protein [Noviherbaspirillum pedocola]|nr:SURF1 family protein [Noviherbaspirillum pedocola]